MSGDMSSDRTKDADGKHEVSRTANEMRAVSERRSEPTVVVVEQKRKRYTVRNLEHSHDASQTFGHPKSHTLGQPAKGQS